MKIKLMGEGLLPECNVGDLEQRRRTHGNLFLAATDHQWQAAHRQYKFRSRQWLKSLQVLAMHERHLAINTRNPAHDFSVKLSLCICSHTDSSCPGCWAYAIPGEDLSKYLLMRDKSCFVQ